MDTRDVTALGEQATLGGLLLDPAPLAGLRQWLRPGDFADTWHGWVFTTLLERHTAHHPIDPVTVGQDMTARYGRRLAALPRLHTLVANTPHAGHVVEYARVVVDAALRREVAGLGVLLRAAAAQTAFDATTAPMAATCNLVDAGLDTAAERWATANGVAHDPVVVPLALRAAARNGDVRESAARYLDAHPARDLRAEHQHEIDLVGTLIAHPEHIAAVADWLPPQRIGDPAWRLLYATTLELAELGRPVDLITVAATAARYAHHGPDLPTVEELRDVVDAGWLAWPSAVLRAVAADQVRRLADVGADQLSQAAGNPGVQVGDIADTGHLITAALRRTATGLPAAGNTSPAPAVVSIRHEAVRR